MLLTARAAAPTALADVDAAPVGGLDVGPPLGSRKAQLGTCLGSSQEVIGSGTPPGNMKTQRASGVLCNVNYYDSSLLEEAPRGGAFARTAVDPNMASDWMHPRHRQPVAAEHGHEDSRDANPGRLACSEFGLDRGPLDYSTLSEPSEAGRGGRPVRPTKLEGPAGCESEVLLRLKVGTR